MHNNINSFISSTDSNVGKKKPIINKNKTEKINILWGLQIKHNIDITFLYFINKFIQLDNINCHIYILIADIHTLIDKSFNKTYNSNIDKYIDKITNFIKLFINQDKFTIIKGSDFQLNKEYILDTYKILTNYNIDNLCQELNINTKKDSFKNILHPLLQSLDEHYIDKTYNINIDMQIGMEYQCRYYTFVKKNNAKLDYKKRLYCLFYIPFELIENPIYLFQLNHYYTQHLQNFNIKTLLFIFNILKELNNKYGMVDNDFLNIDETPDTETDFDILIQKITELIVSSF